MSDCRESSTDDILSRWADGTVTEGQACTELGVTRPVARVLAKQYGYSVRTEGRLGDARGASSSLSNDD
jgi:hypothetical protein